MPSPFPGMDPYLESDLWTSFHAHFAVEIAKQLAPQIQPRYLALTQKRTLFISVEALEPYEGSRFPDVGVLDNPSAPRAGVAIAEKAESPSFITKTLTRVPFPHYWVEIRDSEHRRLVTAIEILSPANKVGRGRRKYLEKRNELLTNAVSLVEIDLLRRGRRMPTIDPLPATPYCVLLHRAAQLPATEVWPVRLDHRLPKVPVPLLAGDDDAVLDLQAALTQVYDSLYLGAAIQYQSIPRVPLNPDDEAWADRMLLRRREAFLTAGVFCCKAAALLVSIN